jgi:hypothetical protein
MTALKATATATATAKIKSSHPSQNARRMGHPEIQRQLQMAHLKVAATYGKSKGAPKFEFNY